MQILDYQNPSHHAAKPSRRKRDGYLVYPFVCGAALGALIALGWQAWSEDGSGEIPWSQVIPASPLAFMVAILATPTAFFMVWLRKAVNPGPYESANLVWSLLLGTLTGGLAVYYGYFTAAKFNDPWLLLLIPIVLLAGSMLASVVLLRNMSGK